MARPRRLLHVRPVAPPAPQEPASGAAEPPPWDRWAPSWEGAEDGVFLELTGTERLYGAGLNGACRVCRLANRDGRGFAGGLASGRLAARLASRLALAALAGERRGGAAAGPPGRRRGPDGGAPGAAAVLAVPPGGDAAFLAPFAIAVLAPSHPRAVTVLAARGVRRLADLQAVPPALLASLLGGEGARLAAAARGEDERPLSGPRPRQRWLVGLRLGRPLSGRQPQAALLHALAGRALAACPAGPACCRTWTLVVRWGGEPGGAGTSVVAAGGGAATLEGWRRQLEAMWRRLPLRRRGVTAVRLLAGEAAPSPRQGELFPAAPPERLAQIWARLRGAPRGSLGLGAESWLERWGAVWEDGAEGAADAGAGGPGGA